MRRTLWGALLLADSVEDWSWARALGIGLLGLWAILFRVAALPLVPAMAVSQLVDINPMLTRVPLSEPGPHREIAFIVRPNYPNLKNIEILMQLFREELAHQSKDKAGS